MSLRSRLKKALEVSGCFARHPRLSLGLLSQFPSLLEHDPELRFRLVRELPALLGGNPELNRKLLRQLPEVLDRDPEVGLKLLRQLPYVRRGVRYSRRWKSTAVRTGEPAASEHAASPNPLRTYFDSHQTGRGIWKLLHYFDIYHRHFSRFVGSEVNVLEIGVHSGGSLEMWRHYFGPKCKVYGVDLEPACKKYENEYTKIFLGDQEDRGFWKVFKKRVPVVDIVIDNGGHKDAQQIVTLEALLPHLSPGGVYLCEDVTGEHSGFAAFMQGLVGNLNSLKRMEPEPGAETDDWQAYSTTELQAWIRAIHFYPFVTVIEKADRRVPQLTERRHGTEWQPWM